MFTFIPFMTRSSQLHSLSRRAAVLALGSLFASPMIRNRALAAAEPPSGNYPFTLGIASGMPRTDSVVLWTRLAPLPHEIDGGLPGVQVQVRWELAEDERFSRGLRTGQVTTRPEHAHSVHVEVAGLPSGAQFFYRFMTRDATSPIGRTRTAPAQDADVARLRLALASNKDLAERMEAAVLAGLGQLLAAWNAGRAKEGDRLRPTFEQGLSELRRLRESLRAEAEAQAAELPNQYQARLEQVLKDAQLAGQLPAERVIAEAGALAERQDVREELVRLQAHLDDFEEKLKKGRLEGKALDVWSQEVLRELNTCGSKCKRIGMTRAVMEAKGVLDQIREQAANLE